MPNFTIRGVQWNVLDVGSGPTLLFVHGFPLDHTMWREQWQAFSPRFRCIVPDLPGFGQSQIVEGKLTMTRLADDLSELLQRMGCSKPYIFCGLSMGGYVGWQMWQRHRDQLSALVQCDTRAAADSPAVARGRQLMAQSIVHEGTDGLTATMLPKLFSDSTRQQHPAMVDEVRSVMRSTDPRAIAAAQWGMSERTDFSEALATIELPTLFVCGEHDVISPIEEMQCLAEAVPNATLVRVPAAGHMAPLENPAAVNAGISAFLATRA